MVCFERVAQPSVKHDPVASSRSAPSATSWPRQTHCSDKCPWLQAGQGGHANAIDALRPWIGTATEFLSGAAALHPVRQCLQRPLEHARAAVRRKFPLGVKDAPGRPSRSSCWVQNCGTPRSPARPVPHTCSCQTEAQARCEIAHLGISSFRFLPSSGLRRERPTRAAPSQSADLNHLLGSHI
jgi:hypothetical protein